MKTVADILSAPAMIALKLSIQEQNLILEGLLGMSSIQKFIEVGRPLSEQDMSKIHDCLRRLEEGEPLPYVLGYTYFDGLKISVSSRVLIPRPDSEVLLHTVLKAVEQADCSLLDLCTGSGALGLAFKFRRPSWRILATDISFDAVKIAQQNADALSLDVHYAVADLLEGLGKFDVIAVNPPYIAQSDSDVDRSVRDFEPALALFSGVEGLDHITRIIDAAPMHLNRNGLLCVEHGHNQGKAVRNFGLDGNWRDVRTIQDLSGKDRVTQMRVNHDR